ncbi:DUF2474 domain-containing protein [Marinicauda pacifica]|uniref:DUF2474 domain-containing protein n=1 Tax=Marinicauda pacifica TaxID=1133559 RepID=UPI0035C78FD4
MPTGSSEAKSPRRRAITKIDHNRYSDDSGDRPLWSRLAWFAVLWSGSVLVLMTVAYFIRLAIL